MLGSALIVVQGELLEGQDPVAVTAVQMGAAAAFSLVFALPTALPVVAPRPEEAIALAALVSVGSLIPFSLYAYGQARVSAEFAGAFVNLEPVVGVASGRARVRQPVRGVAGARGGAGDRRARAQRWRIRAPGARLRAGRRLPGSGRRLRLAQLVRPRQRRRTSTAGWVGVGFGRAEFRRSRRASDAP